jgi:hypothetical protein
MAQSAPLRNQRNWAILVQSTPNSISCRSSSGVKDVSIKWHEPSFGHFYRSIVPISERRRRLVAMLTVYFDESGTLGSDKRATLASEGFVPDCRTHKPRDLASNVHGSIAVACYIADIAAWEGFENDWKALRDNEGVRFHHRTDQESGYGQFKGWSKDRKIAPYQLQNATIKRHTRAGFGCSVVKQDYDEIFTGVSSIDYR